MSDVNGNLRCHLLQDDRILKCIYIILYIYIWRNFEQLYVSSVSHVSSELKYCIHAMKLIQRFCAHDLEMPLMHHTCTSTTYIRKAHLITVSLQNSGRSH